MKNPPSINLTEAEAMPEPAPTEVHALDKCWKAYRDAQEKWEEAERKVDRAKREFERADVAEVTAREKLAEAKDALLKQVDPPVERKLDRR